jgi:hypothetical protein
VRGCGVTVHNPAAVDSMRGRESFFPDGKHPSQSRGGKPITIVQYTASRNIAGSVSI